MEKEDKNGKELYSVKAVGLRRILEGGIIFLTTDGGGQLVPEAKLRIGKGSIASLFFFQTRRFECDSRISAKRIRCFVGSRLKIRRGYNQVRDYEIL